MLPEPPSPKVLEVINSEFNKILPASTDLAKHNDEFLQRNHDSAAHVQASLKVRQLLDPASTEKNQQDLIRTLVLEQCTLEDSVQGLDLLKAWNAKEQYVNDYTAAAQHRWPEATAFKGSPNQVAES